MHVMMVRDICYYIWCKLKEVFEFYKTLKFYGHDR